MARPARARRRYVKLWCPELSKVPAPLCFQPHTISGAERQRLGCDDYPRPLPTLPYHYGGPAKGGGGKAKGTPRDAERATIQKKRRQKNRLQASYAMD